MSATAIGLRAVTTVDDQKVLNIWQITSQISTQDTRAIGVARLGLVMASVAVSSVDISEIATTSKPSRTMVVPVSDDSGYEGLLISTGVEITWEDMSAVALLTGGLRTTIN